MVLVQNVFAILEAILISTKEQQANGKDLGQPCLEVEGAPSPFLRPIREDTQGVTAGGRTTICTAPVILGEVQSKPTHADS